MNTLTLTIEITSKQDLDKGTVADNICQAIKKAFEANEIPFEDVAVYIPKHKPKYYHGR